MSSHSDVSVAIKKALLAKLSEDSTKLLNSFDEHYEDVEGTLFFSRNLWNWGCSVDSEAFIKELHALDAEDNDYCIIDACHDYPSCESGDRGYWFDNPWNTQRISSVTVAFDA